MGKYIKYIRVSTEEQGYEQQELTIRKYLDTVKHDEVIEVREKVSGMIDFNDRKLKSVLDIAEPGDVIVVSELSRLGRSMTNLFEFVGKCQDGSVSIVQAKDGTIIPPDKNNIVSKALLFAFGLAAEIEVMNIRQRVQAGMDARRELLDKNGGWISHKGEWVTGFGREKGCDNTRATEASAIARRIKKENDPIFANAKKQALRWQAEGKTNKEIVFEFNELEMKTPTGREWDLNSVWRLLNK